MHAGNFHEVWCVWGATECITIPAFCNHWRSVRQTVSTTDLRLAPRLEWLWGPTKSCTSDETGTLCLESYFSVSILVTAAIIAIIGHGECKPNYWLRLHRSSCRHFQVCQRWMDELWSDQSLWKSTFPDLGETGSDFLCKVWGFTCMTILA